MRVEIRFDVQSVAIKSKLDKNGQLTTQVVLESGGMHGLSPEAIARLLNLARQAVPLEAHVGTTQQAFDLQLESVPAKTAEPKEILGFPLEK